MGDNKNSGNQNQPTNRVEQIVMPKNLIDVANWHRKTAELQMDIANNFKNNRLEDLYIEWKKSSLAHQKCAELISA